MEQFHQQIIDRWTRDPMDSRFRGTWSPPLGADFDADSFFDRSEYERYVKDLSWLRSAVPFGRYPGKRVLEIGFGTGTDLYSFARRGAEVFGVELTPRQLAFTRQRFERGRRTCRLLRADGGTLPFASDSFDLVYVFDVLHYQPDPDAMMREIRRVLRPGGEALVVEPRIAGDGSSRGELPDPRALRALFAPCEWFRGLATRIAPWHRAEGFATARTRWQAVASWAVLGAACALLAPVALVVAVGLAAAAAVWPVAAFLVRSRFLRRRSRRTVAGFCEKRVEHFPWARVYRLTA